MEPWAQRIWDRLLAGRPHLTQTGLAKKCGRSQPSISQWFNDSDSKPATQMILGDNLVAAASYLGVSAEWIMTGKDSKAAASQSARLDPEKIAVTTRAINRILERRVKGLRVDFTDPLDADLFAEAYAECVAMAEPSEADMVVVVADLMAAREAKRGRESKQVGSVDRSKNRKARAGQ